MLVGRGELVAVPALADFLLSCGKEVHDNLLAGYTLVEQVKREPDRRPPVAEDGIAEVGLDVAAWRPVTGRATGSGPDPLVATGLLSLVEGLIGQAHRLVGIARRRGDARRESDRKRPFGQPFGAQPPEKDVRALRGAKDDEEFLTAESPDGLATSDSTAQHAAEHAQHLIAGRVPESVVDLLEVVEVQHDHGVLGREPAEGTIEHAAVGEAGQRVGPRGLGQPLVPPAELQYMPGVEQEGRYVPFEECTRCAAGRGSGQQRLTVAERDVDREHPRVVRFGRDQPAAELADQVLGDASGVAAGAQPEQGTRRLVHSARHLVARLGRYFHVLAHSWPPSGAPAQHGAEVMSSPVRSAIWKQHITADSRAARPVRRSRNPCVGNPMFLRPHIAAETLGVVPPGHHLEDARPGDIPPGL